MLKQTLILTLLTFTATHIALFGLAFDRDLYGYFDTLILMIIAVIYLIALIPFFISLSIHKSSAKQLETKKSLQFSGWFFYALFAGIHLFMILNQLSLIATDGASFLFNPHYALENLLRLKTASKSDAMLHFLISP